MAGIALLFATLALVALPATAAEAAPKKCKKGYVLKTVKKPNGKKVKKCVKKKKPKAPAADQPQQTQPGTGDNTTDPGGQVTPPPANLPTPPATTRDDAAGQQAMSAAGDLMLEKAEFGSSGQTATYYRIWMLANGYFKYVEVSWNSVSGEICDKVFEGTWTFKEGHTFTVEGGGTVVKVTIASNGPNGDDVVTFANNYPDSVFVGPQAARFERNPHMANNC